MTTFIDAAAVTGTAAGADSADAAVAAYDPLFAASGNALRVIDVCRVNDDFHARHSSIGRSYSYSFMCPISTPLALATGTTTTTASTSTSTSAASAAASGVVGTARRTFYGPLFDQNTTCTVSVPMDIDAMRIACQSFVGTHDFSRFRSVGCTATSPIKAITAIALDDEPFPFPNSYAHRNWRKYRITLSGPSFMYHQVRHMIGALLSIGERLAPADTIERMLREPRVRQHSDPDSLLGARLAPAAGLTLTDVRYPNGFELPD
jgi:tRNA pseudouridine(38-40) synthase